MRDPAPPPSTPRHRRVLLVILAIAGAWALAGPAVAQDAVLDAPAIVRAGSVLELRWSLTASGAREAEVVLSLDGGRHFDLHVSPELDPATGHYAWRVPNLPAREAVLALRAGGTATERVVWRTRPFAIESNGRLPRDRVALRERASWEDVAPLPAPPASWTAHGPVLQAAAALASADAPPRGAGMVPAPGVSAVAHAPQPHGATSSGAAPPARIAHYPLRN